MSAPKKQAAGASGVAWLPNLDLPTAETGPRTRWATPGSTRCLDILRRNGINPPSHNAQLIAYEFCDRLFFLEAVIKRMNPRQVTREEFMRVVDHLGGSYGSTSLQRTYFSAQQHDGVVLGYDLRYVPSCGCMRYVGSPFDL